MTAAAPTVMVFCSQFEGHMRRLLPIVRGLVGAGMRVVVFAPGRARLQVTSVGATLIDLFALCPPDAADAETLPNGMRQVGFAAHYGTQLIAEARAVRPALVIYDTFAVIGRVVATALGIPSVNLCAGHCLEPTRTVAELHEDLPVRVSAACLRGVERLRTEFGLADASPYSYIDGISPWLNIYGEPPQFLTAAERQWLAPTAFFGSLPSIEHIEGRDRSADRAYFGDGRAALRLYVSFGTVIWRYYAREALAAMSAIADAVAQRPDARAVMSLGGAELPAGSYAMLTRPNVTVEQRVDQWAMLEQANAFATHHGLNSTHEAIYHRVPMLSYPFFWDQPAQAAKCQQLGLAERLADKRATLDVATVQQALDRLSQQAASMRERLAEARDWELQVMAGRPAVIRQIVELI